MEIKKFNLIRKLCLDFSFIPPSFPNSSILFNIQSYSHMFLNRNTKKMGQSLIL